MHPYISRTTQIISSARPSHGELLSIPQLSQAFSHFWTPEYAIISPCIFSFLSSLKRKTKQEKKKSFPHIENWPAPPKQRSLFKMRVRINSINMNERELPFLVVGETKYSDILFH